MRLSDTHHLTGLFHVDVWRAGKIIDTIDEQNLIVNGAKNQLARLIGGDGANRQINRIGFGIGVTAASPNDTTLTGALVKAIGGHSYPATGQVRFDWSLSTAEANGSALTEFGLLCADDTLFARKVRAPIQKDADLSLTGSWTIIF